MDLDVPGPWDGSSASSTLAAPSRSPEPTSHALVDHCFVDPDFAAAVEQAELEPDDDAQPGTPDAHPAALALLDLRAKAAKG
jgi:hypothetical protein